jgi:hypothetical protein
VRKRELAGRVTVNGLQERQKYISFLEEKQTFGKEKNSVGMRPLHRNTQHLTLSFCRGVKLKKAIRQILATPLEQTQDEGINPQKKNVYDPQKHSFVENAFCAETSL